MKTVHKVLAYLIALEVVIQAAMIAFAVAGIGVFISDGGTLDEAAFEAIFEGDLTFTASSSEGWTVSQSSFSSWITPST